MHPAAGFKVADEARLLARIAAHPFMTLAAAPEGRPVIAHAPVVARRLQGGLVLDFHLSRGNALAGALAGGFRGLLLNLGPDAYISPDWYESADQVPTWNYVSVEAEGVVTALDDADLIAQLDALSEQEEARLAPKPPWTRAKMSPGVFDRMNRAIVGARMTVERLEGTFKLSQNKLSADLVGAADALGDHPLAGMMRDAAG
jgi:transcriptional regulator